MTAKLNPSLLHHPTFPWSYPHLNSAGTVRKQQNVHHHDLEFLPPPPSLPPSSPSLSPPLSPPLSHLQAPCKPLLVIRPSDTQALLAYSLCTFRLLFHPPISAPLFPTAPTPSLTYFPLSLPTPSSPPPSFLNVPGLHPHLWHAPAEWRASRVDQTHHVQRRHRAGGPGRRTDLPSTAQLVTTLTAEWL